MTGAELTNLSASYGSPLLVLQSCTTGRSFDILNEAIGLFDRYLGEFAIFVKEVEHVSLCDSLGGKIACKHNGEKDVLLAQLKSPVPGRVSRQKLTDE